MIRVLRLISSMNPAHGGPCQGIRNSIPSLLQIGVENEVVCLDDTKEAATWNDGFTVYALGKPKGIWHFHPSLNSWLLNNLPNYDVVISHGLWQYQSFAISKAISQLKKSGSNNVPKHFIMPHGMLDPWFQRSKTRIFKAIRNWVYWKLIEHKVIQNADGLLFTCEEEMRLASTTFIPYHPKNEFNVGYGIQPPPEYMPTMMNSFYHYCPGVEGKKYLLFLSRLHPKKGLDLLVNAYSALMKDPALQNNLPNLVIAGPGLETAYGAKIQQMVAADANLKDIVHFTGMLTGNAKWGAIYGSEAFVLTSHQENFGIAVVEAMACRKPVLISNQVNIWREIEDGGGGLIGADTLDGVVRILKTWLNISAVEKHSMGIHAFDVYKNKFMVEKAAQNIINVFLKSNE
jgi:glycosyltransferase involved in cell wall biosynthesis